MNIQIKKKVLLVMAATNDYMFSVGNVLLGIKKYSPNVFDDILIFTDEKISGNNLNALRQIFPNIMIEIYDYQIPNLDDRMRLSYYSNMPYARFEMLKYLDIYEKVVWFDSDFLIQGDISGLLEYGRTGISMSLDLDPYPTTHNIKPFFVKDIDGYNMNTTAYASGLIIFSDKLKDPLLLREYLYKQLDRYSSYINYAEQGILQLMIEDFGLKVDVFPKLIYHAFPHEDMIKSKIVHLLGDYKPWKTYLGSALDEWYDNHIQWIELGGEEASAFANLLNTNKTNFHTTQELFAARANYKYFNGSKRYQNILFFNSFYNNKVNTIEKVVIPEKQKLFGARARAENYLQYKIGKALLNARNPLKAIILPITLYKINKKHKKELELNKSLVALNPKLKAPKIEEYADYNEAVKVMNNLPYKLGGLFIKHPVTFIFKARKFCKECKSGKK